MPWSYRKKKLYNTEQRKILIYLNFTYYQIQQKEGSRYHILHVRKTCYNDGDSVVSHDEPAPNHDFNIIEAMWKDLKISCITERKRSWRDLSSE